MTKHLPLIDALYELIELAELGRDQIAYEVSNNVQGTLYSQDDFIDAEEKISLAKILADDFYA